MPLAGRASALALAIALAASPLSAQGTATLTGTLRSQAGAPLAGARITLAGQPPVESGSEGAFRLVVPAGRELVLEFAAVGYAPEQRRLEPLPDGARRDLAITLQRLYLLDAVSVVAPRRRPLLDTETATTGASIEREEVDALPTDARDPLTLLFNVPGVAQAQAFFGDAPPLSLNGANALYTQYTLDGLDNNEGFLGGPRVEFPLGGLARMDALVNSYTATAGRSSNGVINLESRAGGNALTGELFTFYRPGRPFDARAKVPFGGIPEAVFRQQDGFRRLQVGGGLAGPITRDRTFFSAAIEYSNENEDRIGSTALAPFLGTEEREKLKLFGRVDHGWSPTQTTTLRVAASLVTRAGQGSGIVTPEADITTRRVGTLTALTHRSAFRAGRASNTASVQVGTFSWTFPPTRSDFSRPQVTVITPAQEVQAVVGSSNFVFDEQERQVQLRDVLELQLGERHTVRAGADLLRSWFTLDAAGTNPNGAYTVFNDGNIVLPTDRPLRFSDIPATARVFSYTVDASPQTVNLTQALVGAFVEDRWRVSPSLTLVGGVRWDYDDLTSRGESSPDLDNIQPRLSFNWLRASRHVVRGGVGLYAGKFPYAIYSDAVQLGPDGNATVTFTGADAPAYLQGPTPQQLRQQRDQLPPREVFRLFALGLEQPMTYQASLGTQLQLGDAWAIAVDGVWSETRNLPRNVDLNPISRPLTAADTVNLVCASAFSCPGDALRPVAPAPGGVRRLSTAASGGRARYVALYTQVRRQLTRAWTVDANWTWSRARNDTEDINFSAVQANCFGADRRDAVTGAPCTTDEWADANNDRRHRVTVRSTYTWRERLRLGVIGDWQTGLPANRLAGTSSLAGTARFDLLGAGPIRGNGFIGNSDRFPGVPRNGERLPSYLNLSTSVAWLVPVFRRDLELRADVFNVLNGTELGGFVNGTGGGGSRTQFGRPGEPILPFTVGAPRQVQFSARYLF